MHPRRKLVERIRYTERLLAGLRRQLLVEAGHAAEDERTLGVVADRILDTIDSQDTGRDYDEEDFRLQATGYRQETGGPTFPVGEVDNDHDGHG